MALLSQHTEIQTLNKSDFVIFVCGTAFSNIVFNWTPIIIRIETQSMFLEGFFYSQNTIRISSGYFLILT